MGDRHYISRRYSLDFKRVAQDGERSSPRVLSARIIQQQPAELQYFSRNFDPDGTVMRQPTDMFGSIIGPKHLPDDKEVRQWPSRQPSQPSQPSRRPSSSSRRPRSEGRRLQMRTEESHVRKSAQQTNVRATQVLDDPLAPRAPLLSLDFVQPTFTIERKEHAMKLDLTAVVATPRFHDPTPKGFRSHHKPVDPIEITPRMNVQAHPAGILPPNTSRHEQRSKLDKIYTCRQQFELRQRQRETKNDREAEELVAEESEVLLEEQVQPSDQGPQREDEEVIQPGTYKDFSGRPVKLDSETGSRRVIKQFIRDKIRWCRYQPDGRGNYVLRPEPEKLTIAKDPPVHHRVPYVELNKTAFNQPKEARKEQRTRELRELDVARRKEEKEAELRQWQESVSARVDEAKTRQRRASVIALHPKEIEATWLKYCVQARAFSILFAAVEGTLREREMKARSVRAAINIQSWVKGKIVLKRMIAWKQQLDALKEKIRPIAYFMLRNWKARRRKRMTDIVRISLQEYMQTNRVKRSISNFIYNVKRLQSVWRCYLKRERARMTLLSRQWERAFTLVRTKGKAGRLGSMQATPRGHAASALASPRRSAQQAAALAAPTEDARIGQHNSVYVSIPQKQVGLLGRLPQYPALKWVALREELARMRGAHLQEVRQYKLELGEHAAFMEQKAVVETVLVGFAEDPRSAHLLTEKLLGDMHRARVPEPPRLHPVLAPRKVQHFILLGVQAIMADFNRQFFEEDPAEGAQLEQPKPAAPQRTKPWWVLHESYSKVAVPEHRPPSPFRASSPQFRRRSPPAAAGARSPQTAAVGGGKPESPMAAAAKKTNMRRLPEL